MRTVGSVFTKTINGRKRKFAIFLCPRCLKQIKRRVDSPGEKCRRCASKTHGLRFHKLHGTWSHQRNRCNNIKNDRYSSYGARGIKVSKEFNKFDVWLSYVLSLPDACRNKYTIDRIDNNGGYKRGNLRWVSKNVQAQNRQKLQGNNTSCYRGVFKTPENRWRARLVINKKRVHLGVFNTKKQAAHAYDSYVIFNNTNHPLNFKRDR